MILAMTAGAMADKPLTALYDAAEELLFETSNVTLTGEAVLSLDGAWFKTARAKYVQDGDRSLWELKLTSPKADGTERENGYTVIADGSKIYVMEVFHPGIYRTGLETPQSTLLRRTIQLDLLRQMLRTVLEKAETSEVNSGIVIEENATGIRIAADENVPPAVNLTLNLIAQYAAKRYLRTDYDQISENHMVSMGYFLTVTQGILACTKSIALKHADISVENDQSGRPEKITGKASVILSTARDGERTLDIDFHAEISDRGESHVGTFTPSEYNVKQADGAMEIEDIENSEVDEYTQEKLINQAKSAWEQAGYKLDPTTFGYSYKLNGRYCTELTDASDNLFLGCVTNVGGKILELRHSANFWQEKSFDYENAYPDVQVVGEAAEKVMEYIRQTNPEDAKRIESLKLQCWLEQDGELYFEFCEDPIAQDWDGILVVVRVKPDWQLEYYSCLSNG
jgi:hypothetical protein